MVEVEGSDAGHISAASRQYDSFVLRWWRVGSNGQRIEVEHVQSGERQRVTTMKAALAWIDAMGRSPSAEGRNQVAEGELPYFSSDISVPESGGSQ